MIGAELVIPGFSILWRIIPLETPTCDSGMCRRSCFSILWRIIPLETQAGRVLPLPALPFQYPLADYPSRDLVLLAGGVGGAMFQYPLADYPSRDDLDRVEAIGRSLFQYPLADYPSRDWRRLAGKASSEQFQYPLADYPSRDGLTPSRIRAKALRFSILWRIIPLETRSVNATLTMVKQFQYPLADYPSRDNLWRLACWTNRPVSVSSGGLSLSRRGR